VWLHKDGRWIDVALTVLRSGKGPETSSALRRWRVNITDQKRGIDQLRRSEARLAQAQRIARIGNWEYEIPTGAVV